MPLEFKRILKDWFKTGIEAGLVATIIALLMNFFQLPLVNVTFSTINVNVRQQLTQGLPTDLGTTALGWLSGLVGFSFPTLLGTLVAALLIVYIGRILYHYSPLQARTPVGRLTWVLVLGSIVSGLIAIWALPTISAAWLGALLALVIYSVIIALVIWGIGEKFTSLRIPE